MRWKRPAARFFRVMHRQVRDMHAAIAEVGILYCTLMVHSGWSDPGRSARYRSRTSRTETCVIAACRSSAAREMPMAATRWQWSDTPRKVSSCKTRGAKAVGRRRVRAFAIRRLHDPCHRRLGGPTRRAGQGRSVGRGEAADTPAGLQRASESIPLEHIRPYVIDVGNNGKLSNTGSYWTTTADVAGCSTRSFRKHQGLAAPPGASLLARRLERRAAVARRIVAFKNVMLANEIIRCTSCGRAALGSRCMA